MNSDVKYFDYRGRSDATFQFFIGGRGIGKSFSVYDEIVQNGERCLGVSKWLYMRLTESEIKASSGDLNCFKDYNLERGTDVQLVYGEQISRIVRYIPYKCKECEEIVIGYAKSIDTFASLRGMSLADVDYIFIDEFIPELSTRTKPIYKMAGIVFKNAYETISRNRELKGRPPVKCVFMGNPNGLQSDILREFGLTKIVAKMIDEGIKRYNDRKRSIYVELVNSTDLSSKKSETAIYKIGGDDNFTRMAIQNEFPKETFKLVQKVNLPEYNPLCQYEDICILKHKSSQHYHVRRQNSTAKRRYTALDKDSFYRDFGELYIIGLLDKIITFETADVKLDIDAVLNRNRLK